jgi:hypothetical protein
LVGASTYHTSPAITNRLLIIGLSPVVLSDSRLDRRQEKSDRFNHAVTFVFLFMPMLGKAINS